MKKIFPIIALALSALGMTSCSDFLDQTSPSELADDAVWSSTYYTELRVNRLYGQLTNDRSYSQDLSIVWCMNSDIELVDGLGDNALNTSSERGAMNYNLDPGWARIGDVWTMLYGIIEDANLNIEGIRGSSLLTSGSESQKTKMQRYLGESLTLRAMIYFDLIRYFGDIPFKTEISKSDLSNAYLGKTDRDVIMDALIKDLEEAINYLPWAGDDISTEHVNKGYAHALLAQIAMTKAGWAIRETAKEGYETATYSDAVYPTQRPDAATRTALYEKALTNLTAIITSGKHDLAADFETLWDKQNKRKLVATTPENLFEIPMGLNVSGELGYTVGVRMNGITSKYGYGNSSGKMKVTAPLLYSYDPSDQRRDITVAPFEIKEDDTKGTIEAMLENAPFGLYVGKWDCRRMANDWLQENLKASAKHMTGINPIKARYANVLLWFAEVMNELYGPTVADATCGMSAYDALAKVHNRAFATAQDANAFLTAAKTDKDAMFKAIVDENAWEFAGEGFRKFELIRWNLLVDKIKEFKQTYLNQLADGTTYQKNVYFNYIKDANGNPTNRIDFSTITWYTDASASADSYDASAKSFGNGSITSETDTQVRTNLPSISNGLVGKSTVSGTTITYEEPAVKNRYLIPIASTTISASNGMIHNSYGYSD